MTKLLLLVGFALLLCAPALLSGCASRETSVIDNKHLYSTSLGVVQHRLELKSGFTCWTSSDIYNAVKVGDSFTPTEEA